MRVYKKEKPKIVRYMKDKLIDLNKSRRKIAPFSIWLDSKI